MNQRTKLGSLLYCLRQIERDTVIEAKSQADESSGPAGLNPREKQAEDMTAPETFAEAAKKPLTRGAVQTGHDANCPISFPQPSCACLAENCRASR